MGTWERLRVLIPVVCLVGAGAIAWRVMTKEEPTDVPHSTPSQLELVQSTRHAAQAELRRILLSNEEPDDAKRGYFFMKALDQKGFRCDEIVSALMREPGTWDVKCSPGYGYRFKFDHAGTLTSAVRAY